MQLASFTHSGRRRENQDCIRIEQLPDGRVLAALADGMGGHQGGAYASRRALEVLASELRNGEATDVAVSSANAALNEDAKRPEWNGMGTTLVGALVGTTHYSIFNVGDSRGYRITERGEEQITDDHSFVADAVREGRMTRAEAEGTRWKNALTRSLGGDPTVAVDIFGPFARSEDAIVVLCCDGVYKALPDGVLAKVVLGTPDIPTAARALVDTAFRYESDDNLSTVLLEFGTVRRTADPVAVPEPVLIQEERLATLAKTKRSTSHRDPRPMEEDHAYSWPSEGDLCRSAEPGTHVGRTVHGIGRKRSSRSSLLHAALLGLCLGGIAYGALWWRSEQKRNGLHNPSAAASVTLESSGTAAPRTGLRSSDRNQGGAQAPAGLEQTSGNRHMAPLPANFRGGALRESAESRQAAPSGLPPVVPRESGPTRQSRTTAPLAGATETESGARRSVGDSAATAVQKRSPKVEKPARQEVFRGGSHSKTKGDSIERSKIRKGPERGGER